ncbi:unnamed protein product [Mesocestoides corti]|uniref:Uncharacterized protein n=1 Tax=Mesocestoides corti TaxID=53468 RepID=A0A0R3UMX9_MESCO|nr:unnamed protein product [Mesocestoides corti]
MATTIMIDLPREHPANGVYIQKPRSKVMSKHIPGECHPNPTTTTSIHSGKLVVRRATNHGVMPATRPTSISEELCNLRVCLTKYRGAAVSFFTSALVTGSFMLKISHRGIKEKEVEEEREEMDLEEKEDVVEKKDEYNAFTDRKLILDSVGTKHL